MNTDILIAFLVGVTAAVLIAVVTVFLTLFVRNRLADPDSGRKNNRGGGKKDNSKRSGPKVSYEEQKGEYTIRLKDERQSGKVWTYQIDRELLIGRGEDCDLQLPDKSVGRTQCKIVIREHGLEVVDLGAANRTKLNTTLVFSGSPLKRGDVLQFGRERLTVESIQHLGREEPGVGDETEPVPEWDDDRESRQKDKDRDGNRSRAAMGSSDTKPVWGGQGYED